MRAGELIAAYERILEITDGMLAAARRGDWERLTALEGDCRAEVGRLLALGDDLPRLDEPLRRRKVQIVKGVLESDAEIRRLVEPRMAELEQLIGHVRNEQRLTRAYG